MYYCVLLMYAIERLKAVAIVVVKIYLAQFLFDSYNIFHLFTTDSRKYIVKIIERLTYQAQRCDDLKSGVKIKDF